MMQFRRTLPRGALSRVIAAGQIMSSQQRGVRAPGILMTRTTRGTIITPRVKSQKTATPNVVPRWG